MNNTAQAGQRGKDIRSDCWIELQQNEAGGNHIILESKVRSLYGRQIEELLQKGLGFFGLHNVTVRIEDSGALPYVISARFEAAVKRLLPEKNQSFLPDAESQVQTPSSRDRFRRSRLYLPGNDPKLAINAGLHQPDGIILDLEDSVAPLEKDAARILVRNTLRLVNFYGAERMVRINQHALGLEDLQSVIPQKPNVILVPKCESKENIEEVEHAIEQILREQELSWDVFLMPIIESAKGTINAYEIAQASENIVALAIGLEDYTADIGAERTLGGEESRWMRGAVLNAARAAGVQPIDTVFSDVNDMDGLFASSREARLFGFDGKGCIHPRQIDVVHRAFAPEQKELEKAMKIVIAFDEAEKCGLGVVSLGAKMIDPPVVKRAHRTIEIAIRSGLLTQDWKEAYHA